MPHFLTLLLWAVAIYALILLGQVFRARHALLYARRSSKLFGEGDVEPCALGDLPRRVRGYFERREDELAGADFRPLCTYSSLSSKRSIGGQNYSRVLVSGDGRVIAGISYFLTPRWLFAPYVRQPCLRLTGRVTKGIVFESELEDGAVLSTHQLPADPKLPPDFVSQRRPESEPARELAERHRRKLDELSRERGSAAKRIASAEEYFAFYRRAKTQLADFRRRAFERRLDETLRNVPFKDMIDPQ